MGQQSKELSTEKSEKLNDRQESLAKIALSLQDAQRADAR